MEQLLLHLIGDYILQTNWMANNKTKHWWPAWVHACVYSIPFQIYYIPSFLAFLVIVNTHFLIDHFRLARYVIFFKNKVTDFSLQFKDCKETGYHSSMPPHISFWLLVITDNTLHLCINYAALRWL